MLFTFTREVAHANDSKDRRVRKTGLDRSHDSRLLVLVAAGAGYPRLHDRERTNGLLESSRPLAEQDGAHAGEDGPRARQNGWCARRLVGHAAVERQPRLR